MMIWILVTFCLRGVERKKNKTKQILGPEKKKVKEGKKKEEAVKVKSWFKFY